MAKIYDMTQLMPPNPILLSLLLPPFTRSFPNVQLLHTKKFQTQTRLMLIKLSLKQSIPIEWRPNIPSWAVEDKFTKQARETMPVPSSQAEEQILESPERLPLLVKLQQTSFLVTKTCSVVCNTAYFFYWSKPEISLIHDGDCKNYRISLS